MEKKRKKKGEEKYSRGTHKVEVTRGVVVAKVATVFGYSDLVVFTMLRVKFNKSICLQKYQLQLKNKHP